MSVFITAGSGYDGKHSEDIIFRPLFAGEDPRDFGVRVIMTKERTITLTFWEAIQKRMRAYTTGFQGGTSSQRTSKRLNLSEFKVEAAYSKQDYIDTIYDLITNRNGVTQNDITGTTVHNAEIQLFQETIGHDVFMTFFTSDTLAATWDGTEYDQNDTPAVFDSLGALTTGGQDIRNNTIRGVWAEIFDNIANEAAADKITRVTIANGAVAQDTDVDYTGLTAGTVGLDVNNVTLSVPFITNLATTMTAWVTAHAATVLAWNPGIVATATATELNFVSSIPGAPIILDAVTGTGAAGTITDAVANVLASLSLSVDEAETTFTAMRDGANLETRAAMRTPGAVIHVTQSMWDNYADTLSRDNPAALESMRQATQDGITVLRWQGIPLMLMEIDGLLAADTANEYPHRALLTVRDNLALIMNGSIGSTRMWFNPDENENRQRSQFEMEADFIEPRIMVVAY